MSRDTGQRKLTFLRFLWYLFFKRRGGAVQHAPCVDSTAYQLKLREFEMFLAFMVLHEKFEDFHAEGIYVNKLNWRVGVQLFFFAYSSIR